MAGKPKDQGDKVQANRSTGKNTVSGQQLSSFIDRLERLDQEKKSISADMAEVFAEAKAFGFNPKTIRKILKHRAMKPHDREEEESMFDLYLHAIGMDVERPLFAAVGQLSVDPAVKEQVIDALKQLVPQEGEIIVKVSGQAVRLWRDAKGKPQAEDYKEPTPGAPPQRADRPAPPAPPAEVAGASAAEAEELGGQAFHANQPITANPFPFGDKRRPRWDQGWRSASGSDGMGPRDAEPED